MITDPFYNHFLQQQWLDDSTVTECKACERPFGVKRRCVCVCCLLDKLDELMDISFSDPPYFVSFFFMQKASLSQLW